MLGYNEMKEVLLWVQTTEAAEVQFAYWPTEEPRQRYLTDTYQTLKTEAYTAKLMADKVEPGVHYTYELLINGQTVKLPYPTTFTAQPLWAYRTEPPTFTLATGSCMYVNEEKYDRPGTPYGSDYGIFASIAQKKPDAMLWLGDNTYMRDADWYSQTGILHRYTHTRSLPELQPLLASTHHYAIWDDHDYGPNDSNRSYVHKQKTERAFQLFWGNPVFGVNGQGGCTSFFQYGDIDFFLLDDRYFRSPNERTTDADKTILGKPQMEWLVDALVTSRAPFKIVAIGGQFLNTAAVYENFSAIAPADRAYLLQRIQEENIRNVIFLTGDRHHSELSKLNNSNGRVVYDLTISPLTAGVGSSKDEQNMLRVPNTLTLQHNFATLTFRGPRKARELFIQVFDKEGVLLWDYLISEGK